MVNGIQDLIPTAKIAHVGMYRDEETLEPHTYFEKYPKNLEEAITIVVDPMLATGGSSVAAIDMVKKSKELQILNWFVWLELLKV